MKNVKLVKKMTRLTEKEILRHLNQHPRLSFTNKMKAKGLFSINHYVGNVTYNTKDFCFKKY